jgi:hypothetical protein
LHPWIGTIAPAVSELFFHPFPGVGVAVAVTPLHVTGVAVSVGIVPVGVYVGSWLTFSPPIIFGGQSSPAVASGASVPAPAPPVWEGLRGGVHGSVFPQVPAALRGSGVIQPSERPRE